MKKLSAGQILVILLTLVVFAPHASAMGVGVSLTGGLSESDWEEENWGRRFFSSDDTMGAIGYIFDTNILKDRLYNYRLGIGWEKNVHEMDAINDTLETSGLYMTHNFCFGIIRKKNLRVWTGPEIRLAKLDGEFRKNSNVKVDVFSTGFGMAVGVNFKVNEKFVLALKGGILDREMHGDGRTETTSSIDYEGDGTLSYITMSFIFRAGED